MQIISAEWLEDYDAAYLAAINGAAARVAPLWPRSRRVKWLDRIVDSAHAIASNYATIKLRDHLYSRRFEPCTDFLGTYSTDPDLCSVLGRRVIYHSSTYEMRDQRGEGLVALKDGFVADPEEPEKPEEKAENVEP